MTKLEKLYSIIENSRDVGVKLPKGVLQQVEELEEGIIKEEILPALSSDIDSFFYYLFVISVLFLKFADGIT